MRERLTSSSSLFHSYDACVPKQQQFVRACKNVREVWNGCFNVIDTVDPQLETCYVCYVVKIYLFVFLLFVDVAQKPSVAYKVVGKKCEPLIFRHNFVKCHPFLESVLGSKFALNYSGNVNLFGGRGDVPPLINLH